VNHVFILYLHFILEMFFLQFEGALCALKILTTCDILKIFSSKHWKHLLNYPATNRKHKTKYKAQICDTVVHFCVTVNTWTNNFHLVRAVTRTVECNVDFYEALLKISSTLILIICS
jgi:hypothetical protein